MGISTEIFTVYGLKLPYDTFGEEFEEKYYELCQKEKLPFVLMDGMGGEYVIIGKVLFRSIDFRWMHSKYETGDVEIDLLSLSKHEREYRQEFSDMLPDEYDRIPKRPFNLLCFTYYS